MSLFSQDFSESNIRSGNGGSGAVGSSGGDIGSRNMVTTTSLTIHGPTTIHYPLHAPEFKATEISSNPGDAIPPKPAIFCGRDDLVREIVSEVLNLERRHVALVGPGGIGKSCISKAVMHEDRLKEYFKNHRRFVTYDDPFMSQNITFLQHLTDALSSSSATTLPAILARFNTSPTPTLLVIDNAETFLDLDTAEGGYMSTAIADLGGCKSVHLILTTSSGKLPNLSWARRDIMGLDVAASRKLFFAVYQKDIGNHLDALFTMLDHHPLSISLLSHVASRKGCKNPEEIKEAWKQQHTRLLKIGVIKSQSLGITIEHSINSPSLQAEKTVVLSFLRLVAFLPEGIHYGDLPGIFPEASDIKGIADSVWLSSLTYKSGDRYTMLAPFRMYIMDHYNANLSYKDPVLVSTRDYLYAKLTDNPKSWVIQESINTERLISFDLSSDYAKHRSKACLRALKSAKELIFRLDQHYPRGTRLHSLVESVSEKRPLLQWGGVGIGSRRNKQLSLAKAEFLNNLTYLASRYPQEQHVGND